MRRRETEPLEKRMVNFYKGDFEKLQTLHPIIGASKAVRMIMRAHIARAEEAMRNKTPVKIEGVEI